MKLWPVYYRWLPWKVYWVSLKNCSLHVLSMDLSKTPGGFHGAKCAAASASPLGYVRTFTQSLYSSYVLM